MLNRSFWTRPFSTSQRLKILRSSASVESITLYRCDASALDDRLRQGCPAKSLKSSASCLTERQFIVGLCCPPARRESRAFGCRSHETETSGSSDLAPDHADPATALAIPQRALRRHPAGLSKLSRRRCPYQAIVARLSVKMPEIAHHANLAGTDQTGMHHPHRMDRRLHLPLPMREEPL